MPEIHDGEVLGEQKINELLNHTLLAPVAYTPVVNAPSVTTGKLMRIGKLVLVEFSIEFTGAVPGLLTMSAPSTIPGPSLTAVGSALALDGGVGSTRRSLTIVSAGPNVQFNVDNLAASAAVTNNVPWTWASGDTLAGSFTYLEA